jgi:hypothetical protein
VWERIRADVIGGMSYRRAGLKWDTEWRTIASRARREGWARNVLEAERDRTLLLEDTARALSAAPAEEALLAQARRALADALDRGEAKDVRELALAVRALTPARRREAEPEAAGRGRARRAAVAGAGARCAEAAGAGGGRVGLADLGVHGRAGRGQDAGGGGVAGRLAQDSPGARFALVAPTLHDVREVMVEGESGLVNLPRAGRPRWEASRRRLRWANGAVAQGFRRRTRRACAGRSSMRPGRTSSAPGGTRGRCCRCCGWGCGWAGRRGCC